MTLLRIYLTDTSACVQDPASCHCDFTSAAMKLLPISMFCNRSWFLYSAMSQNMYGIKNNNYNEYTCIFLATNESLKIHNDWNYSIYTCFAKAELRAHFHSRSYIKVLSRSFVLWRYKAHILCLIPYLRCGLYLNKIISLFQIKIKLNFLGNICYWPIQHNPCK